MPQPCHSAFALALVAVFAVVGPAHADATRTDALAGNVDVVDVGVGLGVDDLLAASLAATTLPTFTLALPSQQKGGPPPGPPQLSGVGLGLQVGFPTALTLKLGKAQQDGFAFGLGAGFSYDRFFPFLSIHGEYQLHLFTLVRTGDLALTGYFAPGLWLGFFGSGRYGFYNGFLYGPALPFSLGVRGTLGLSMTFTKAAPVELYLELTPALFVFPGFDPGMGWSLGFRYYF